MTTKIRAQQLPKYLPDFKKCKRTEKIKLLNELKELNSNNISKELTISPQFGIEFHHSGYTTEERQ